MGTKRKHKDQTKGISEEGTTKDTVRKGWHMAD
jgi:hypothetical protein